MKEVRQDPLTANIPIIIMTAKSEESDVVVGLTLGADDYVTKPFSMSVLVARVAAVLRRAATGTPGNGPMKVGSITLDTERHIVKVDDEIVALTLTEFRLLMALAGLAAASSRATNSSTRRWASTPSSPTAQLTSTSTSLRQKLGEARSCLQTVRGVGYRLVAEGEDGH